MGSKSDPNKAAMRIQEDLMRQRQNIDRPVLEEYILQSPELVGMLEAEQLDPSEMANIVDNMELRGNQEAVLEQLAKISEEGYTDQDRAEMEAMLGDVAAQESARRKAIDQEMARKGMSGSGDSYIQKLLGSQSAANQARQQAQSMGVEGRQRALDTLQRRGALSSEMQQQEFNRKAMQAQAQDAIARANAMNRQGVSAQNLAARQAIANQRSNIANQQAGMSNQLTQQDFQNQLAQISGDASTANAMSQIAANAPQKPGMLQAGLAGAGTGAAVGGPWGAAIGAGFGMMSAAEDGGLAYQNGGVVQKQNHIQKYAEAEIKAHEKFKKDYMKRVREELAPQKEAAEEVTRDRVHAEDGAMAYQDGGISFQDKFRKSRAALGPGATFMWQGKEYSTDLADETEAQTIDSKAADKLDSENEWSKEDSGKLSKGLGALSKMLGSGQQERRQLVLDQPAPVTVENTMPQYQPQQFENPYANFMQAQDGGMGYACGGVPKAEDGSYLLEDGVIDVGESKFAGDRIDAKVNEGEMIINVPQQQRLMDLIRGEISVDELGDDDIVEGVPREYRDEMHEEAEMESEGIMKLLKMLGEE